MQAPPKAFVVNPPVQVALALLRHRLLIPACCRGPLALLIGAAADLIEVVAQGQVVEIRFAANQGRRRLKPVTRLCKLPHDE